MKDMSILMEYACNRMYCIDIKERGPIKGLLMNYNNGNIILLSEAGIYHILYNDIVSMRPISYNIALKNCNKNYIKAISDYLEIDSELLMNF